MLCSDGLCGEVPSEAIERILREPRVCGEAARALVEAANAAGGADKAYKDYRRYLLETSQLPGGFYSSRGRRQLLRHVVDMMLSPEDPYDALKSGSAAPRQQLRLVN